MFTILKRYIKIYNSNDYSLISIKSILIAILSGLLFYINGDNGNINQLNNIVLTLFSALIIMYSCDCINNEFFINVNEELFEKESFSKKIIASNISCIIHFILYIVILILINLYFSYYSETLKLLIMIINLIMLSMSIGNLLLITNKDTIIFNIKNNKGASKQKAIIQFIKQILISLFLGIILYWILYKFNSIVLFPLILVIYILSLIVNQKINCYTNK